MLWLQFSNSPHFYRVVVALLLQFTSMYFYNLSLAGGEIEWVKQHLFELGVDLFLSVALFCVAFLIAVSITSRRDRVIVLAIQIVLVLLLFISDRGDNFLKHGSYNALLFVFMSFLILSISLGVMFCYSLVQRKDMFWKVLIITVILVVSLTWWRLSVHRELWSHGLLGKQLDRDAPGMCSFESRGNLPFVDLLPGGAQNFWTGSQTCPKPASEIDAKIDINGILTMHCTKAQGKARYTLLPNTIPIGTDDKKQDALPEVIAKLSVRHDYSQPLLLPENQETVLVHCGELTELRMNVQLSQRIRKIQYEAGPGNDGASKTSSPGEASVRDADDDAIEKPSLRPMNTLVLFFDAVGRRHMMRRMPKTMEVLESLHVPTRETNGAKKNRANGLGLGDGRRLFQFFRYHVVGYNTDPNTRVLYTGDIELNPERRSIAEDVFEHKFRDASNAKHTRYMVARAESNCEDWGAQYAGRASSQTSYDHEFIAPMCDNSYFSHDGHPFGNFRGPYSVLRRCLHGKYVHAHTFEYLRNLQRRYRSRAPEIPWLMFGSFIEGHEGTGEVLATTDQDMANFLLQLAADGTFKDTALFIVADHGLHMGLNFVYSMNGVIEHANPALFALLPERYLSQDMVDTLEHNEQALVTAYNIHHTWRDLLGLEGMNEKQSLLRSKMRLNDKCVDANIRHDLCQCK